MKRKDPSLKEKTRYIRFKINCPERQDLGDTVDHIWSSALQFMGSKGCSEADIWVIANLFEEEEQEGVVRVNRNSLEGFRAALTSKEKIGGDKGFLEICKVSGSIEKVK